MTKRKKFTELGYPTIPSRLIGKKTYAYFVPNELGLSSPDRPLHYFDDYLRSLYDMYPPEAIFGPKMKRVANCTNLEELDYFQHELWLGNHGKNLLRTILQENVRLGLWQPHVIGVQTLESQGISSAEEFLEAIKNIKKDKYEKPANQFEELVYGIHMAHLRGFVFPIQYQYTDKEYVFVIPSQKFVEHLIRPHQKPLKSQ